MISNKETGHVNITEPITSFKLESPGGPVEIQAICANGRVLEVGMTPSPCFVAASNIKVRLIFCLKQLAYLNNTKHTVYMLYYFRLNCLRKGGSP